jgi:hypothetical protein
VTCTPSWVTALLSASRIWIRGWIVSGAPLVVIGDGWVAIVRRDAVPGTMVKGALTAGSSVPEVARRV